MLHVYFLWCRIDAHFVIKVADFGLSEDVHARKLLQTGKGTLSEVACQVDGPRESAGWCLLWQDWCGQCATVAQGWPCCTKYCSFTVLYSGLLGSPAGRSSVVVKVPILEWILSPWSSYLDSGQRLSKPANSACPDEMWASTFLCLSGSMLVATVREPSFWSRPPLYTVIRIWRIEVYGT